MCADMCVDMSVTCVRQSTFESTRQVPSNPSAHLYIHHCTHVYAHAHAHVYTYDKTQLCDRIRLSFCTFLHMPVHPSKPCLWHCAVHVHVSVATAPFLARTGIWRHCRCKAFVHVYTHVYAHVSTRFYTSVSIYTSVHLSTRMSLVQTDTSTHIKLTRYMHAHGLGSFAHMSIHMSVRMSMDMSIDMRTHRSVDKSTEYMETPRTAKLARMSVHMSAHLSAHISLHMSTHISVHTSMRMYTCQHTYTRYV